jgi:hypothetical protein
VEYLDPFGGGPLEPLLGGLEEQLPLLPEGDQAFILGCRINLDSGHGLDEKSKERLRKLAAQLAKVTHNALEQRSSAEAPTGPSPIDMLRNLARVRHTLRVAEQQFANSLAAKWQRGSPLSPNEVTRLSNLHKAKGF